MGFRQRRLTTGYASTKFAIEALAMGGRDDVIWALATATTYPSWGYENRTVAVRVPAGSNAARRLEHRVAGADANPYLLFAVLLASMMVGMRGKVSPGKPISGDGYSQITDSLPSYMHEAVALFSDSEFIRDNLGAEIQRIFTLTKEQEIAEFRRRVTALEYQSYLERL